MREFAGSMAELLNFCALYYTIQLVRCALISVIVYMAVVLLRKTIFKNRVFGKGALWIFFLPILFAGKMKFFYESAAGSFIFTYWTGFLIRRPWLGWLYFGVVFLYAARLLYKRRRLKRLIDGMEKRSVDGTPVFVTELPVSPFTMGVFHPRIVVPRMIWERYSGDELRLILLHEKEHIRLGHLAFYLLWDVLRVLLWINPLLSIGTWLFREDMEEICDVATIQKEQSDACEYGQLLLKTMQLLQTESRDFNMYASFAGNPKYRDIRQRVTRIAEYRPYKRALGVSVFALFILLCVTAIAGIHIVSYGRNTENDTVLAYGFDGENVTFSDVGGDALRQMVSWDDRYVYVDRDAFERYLREQRAAGDIFIVFGGIYKLPGVGGFGYSCCYEPGGEGPVARIPYDNREDDWRVKLLKLL